MKLLFLAPQPFFQERGTPIAVRLALQVLTERISRQQRTGVAQQIDLITYAEGAAIELPGVSIQRIPTPSFLKGVGPGISFKKLLCDVVFLFSTINTIRRKKADYDLIHAVEESVFIAWLAKKLFGIPYVYDMDSSLALQLTEKWFLLKPLYPILSAFEKLVVRNSDAVVPVCDALAAIAERHGSKFTSVLNDISLLNPELKESQIDLRKELALEPDTKLIVYIGNLEGYQGVDLLLQGFAELAKVESTSRLVIIGGKDEHIEHYKARAKDLGAAERVLLAGPRPLASLDNYIMQADVLVSPRVKGNNTPMKIYSYLHSGKPVVATNLPTHTQVLNPNIAELCEPNPKAMAQALLKLLSNQSYAQNLGKSARIFAERRYTFENFSRTLNEIYDYLSSVTPKSAANS